MNIYLGGGCNWKHLDDRHHEEQILQEATSQLHTHRPGLLRHYPQYSASIQQAIRQVGFRILRVGNWGFVASIRGQEKIITLSK